MRPVMALALSIFSCVAAGDPPPPIEVAPEWKKNYYKLVDRESRWEETWHFQQAEFGAVLFVTHQKCSPCEPIDKAIVPYTNKRPNDKALLVQQGKHSAVFRLSTEALKHLSTSFIIATDAHRYGLHMTVLDSITARDHMKLQQELMRMVEAWEPE